MIYQIIGIAGFIAFVWFLWFPGKGDRETTKQNFEEELHSAIVHENVNGVRALLIVHRKRLPRRVIKDTEKWLAGYEKLGK